MADFELKPNRVLVRNWGGSGVQFNQHVYAAITGVPEQNMADLRAKIMTLAPQIVRIFFNDKQDGDPADPNQTLVQKDRWTSFVRTVKLAEAAGATTNVTWQSGAMTTAQDRETSMRRFADVLDALVTTSGIANLSWVTLQNEPNTPPRSTGGATEVTPERLGAMYRKLDQRLADKGIRQQIRFMGGDLIEGPPNPNSPYNHRKWFAHMSNRMSDILDAYSVHVYWNYWDVARFQQRLRDVQEIAGGLAHRKPLFVTEYGTRGRDRRPNTIDDPGNFREGSANPVPLAQTNVAAFQHAWFQILAAQLGYAGTVKWDGYYGKYDRGTQAYYTIGKPETDGWPLYPTYFLLRLVTMTTEAGWRVLQLNQSASSERTKHLAAFAGGDDELTILGLDSEGADVNTTSSTRVDYTIGGLPPRASFSLLLWNKSGNGQIVRDSTVTANADGVAQVRSVPLQSVFALTTKALPPA